MGTQIEIAASVESLLSVVLDRNDLGRLAQLHSQMLAAREHFEAAGDADALRSAAETASLLERVILDEAPDPAAALQQISAACGTIAASLRGADGAAPAAPIAALPPIRAAESLPTPPAPVAEPTAACSAPDAPSTPAVESYVSEPLLIDMAEQEHIVGFLEEATEHMDAIEAGLLAVERSPTNADTLNELFRPFHTIKGIAGFLNLRDINRLTHEIETILDLGRRSEMKITAAIVDLIFAAVDQLKAQLKGIQAYLAAPTGGPCQQPDIVAIMRSLRLAAVGQYTEADAPTRAAAEDDDEPVEDASREAAAADAAKRATLDTSIRVDTSKLDTLVDAVGELVIAQSMVGLSKAVFSDEKLARNVAQVTKIVRDVQETAMAMRMVPIGHTFQKMRRLVRDVARKAGKQVDLQISGEETELDKTVIQQISDPLVHMVRNAVDHGIEDAEARRAAGKPPTGAVCLNAFHQGGSIVIEIRDDGRGLDRDKLLAKGIERGVFSPDDQPTDQQIYGIVFQSGVSTAEVVTDISGRGVGMDVVRRNVEQLRGKIDIQTEPGKGSTFAVRLPLTLAIIDGMIVRVGEERLIIPTILIEQSLQPKPEQVTTVQGRGQMVQVRRELCPLIQLGSLFGFAPPVDPCENLVVIVQSEGQKVALVVNELIGQQQVVIKSLGDRFKSVRGVSGAAILGDGRVGLILEPTGLLTLHSDRGGGIFHRAAAESPAAAGKPAGQSDPRDAWSPSETTNVVESNEFAACS